MNITTILTLLCSWNNMYIIMTVMIRLASFSATAQPTAKKFPLGAGIGVGFVGVVIMVLIIILVAVLVYFVYNKKRMGGVEV